MATAGGPPNAVMGVGHRAAEREDFGKLAVMGAVGVGRPPVALPATVGDGVANSDYCKCQDWRLSPKYR